ncbi:Abscisic acid 8'-hydroxylase 4 [Heracleum sosnowskyi]|uniref:(+)-abscisic acid 8'-hydroxylase n=1 Tax=Heracleum sosnowskyi TaxID=360622 RepID=A0AAD8GLI2_9APIA|nr:Abscisic acid 8'-hydroxylase 4 [Heracleum sosnowskyi]KAK1383287.1 Abscisic acid 8'-hydroxylase 4 [Heracleum sosnowskyi]
MEGAFMFQCFFFIALAIFSYLLFKHNSKASKTESKLPPGSLGWPYIGETLKLFSQNPSLFFDSRYRRHGEIFKTHILGYPCVMLASPEAARFVLVTHADLFKPSYPKSKETLIGPSAIFFHQGNYHSQIRKLVQNSLSLNVIRSFIPAIEFIALSTLDSWCNGTVINTFQQMKKFTFDTAVLSIFGELDSEFKDRLKYNYHIVDTGYNSFPINLPGTLFRKALLARRRLEGMIHDKITQARERKWEQNNLLTCLLNYKDEDGQFLEDNQIADNIIGVLFAAQDTTASVLTWIIKYISDDQDILTAVEREHKALYVSSEGGTQTSLTWAHTRNMPFTQRVISECLRMASIVAFTYREAVIDVEYNGFLIPKGWKALPLFRSIHHNPEFFPQPEKFDPSRFEGVQKPNTYMPFGNGTHACPGNEVAKLEMLILIHHLVRNFRWELATPKSGDCGVQYAPFLIPAEGLPAKFWKKSDAKGHA